MNPMNAEENGALMRILLQSPEAALEDVLSARENRAECVRGMLHAHACPVVSLTLNIPGARKAHALAEQAYRIAAAALRGQLRAAGLEIRQAVETAEKTGFEGAFAVAGGAAAAVKNIALRIEEEHPLGRLFDIDVAGTDGLALRGAGVGRAERRCIVCGEPVWACARSRTHSAEELGLRAAALIQEYLRREFADLVAEIAVRSLLDEVVVSPKPGLVDRRNNGAHGDMDLFTFGASAAALAPYFRDMALRGLALPAGAAPGALLPRLRVPGVAAEERMFAATGGVNTHKGLVFSLGILCAAAGILCAAGGDMRAEKLLDACAAIAAEAPGEFAARAEATHGREAHRRFGLTGVRGEAAAGYPNVRGRGLPVFRDMLARGHSFNDAGVAALLHLMAHVEDTNIASRAGAETLAAVQAEVREFLAAGPGMAATLSFAEELDGRFIARGISPGGSADLLALVFFLHRMEGCGRGE